MQREQLGQADEWYCRGCKNHVCAFKKMDIWRLPPLLVFQLKRFTYEVGQWSTHREKLEGYVDFPFEVDMANYAIGQGAAATDAGVSPGSPGSPGGAADAAAAGAGAAAGGGPSAGADKDATEAVSTKYELVAVSNHVGDLGGGHYTAYAKRGDKWYDCNDSTVREVKPESVRTSKAYVLFYRRVNTNEAEGQHNNEQQQQQKKQPGDNGDVDGDVDAAADADASAASTV